MFNGSSDVSMYSDTIHCVLQWKSRNKCVRVCALMTYFGLNLIHCTLAEKAATERLTKLQQGWQVAAYLPQHRAESVLRLEAVWRPSACVCVSLPLPVVQSLLPQHHRAYGLAGLGPPTQVDEPIHESPGRFKDAFARSSVAADGFAVRPCLSLAQFAICVCHS